MSEVQPLQKFAEVHFSAQKRLKFAKLLKNIEESSKILQNKPSKYIHLRTSLSACKITKKSPPRATFELWLEMICNPLVIYLLYDL